MVCVRTDIVVSNVPCFVLHASHLERLGLFETEVYLGRFNRSVC